MLHDGLEWVEDWDTKSSLAFSADTDELIRHEPDVAEAEDGDGEGRYGELERG